jgi:hypothetical protein
LTASRTCSSSSIIEITGTFANVIPVDAMP